MQAWIDLILLAQHQVGTFTDRRGNLIDGKRGCVYRSERFLAETWGWSLTHGSIKESLNF